MNYSLYENCESKVLKLEGLKKKNIKLNSNDRSNNVKHFSVIAYKQDRTFYKQQWNSEQFKNNEWHPKNNDM